MIRDALGFESAAVVITSVSETWSNPVQAQSPGLGVGTARVTIVQGIRACTGLERGQL
jgi:hypothetical protein